MIVVVNPNVGLDYMLFFEAFHKHSVIRAGQAKWGLGGKGLVAAYLLAGLGEPVWVTGFSGGITGEYVEELLTKKGAETDFVSARGTARINVVLTESKGGWQTTITAPGIKVNYEHVKILTAKVKHALEHARCLLLGGSLPPGCPPSLYRDLIAEAKGKGVPSVLDTSGHPLVEAVNACPVAIKPNQHEASELTGMEIKSIDEAFAVARWFRAKGIPWVVISLGSQGLVAIGDGKELHVPAPPVSPKSTAGAGDALSAGLALGLAKHWGLCDSIRWGLALAAAVMEAESVLECDLNRVPVWLKALDEKRV
jgi:1-phosphofructokinase family hexose kinase